MEKRFVHKEFSHLKIMTAFISQLLYMKDDMKERLGEIEDGQERLNKILDEASKLAKDIIATGPASQKRQIYSTINDCKIELVPKLAPKSTNVILTKQQAKQLIDLAQEKCKSCVEDPKAAQKCALYQLLEVTVQLDSYDTLLCPFSQAKWAE